MCASGCIKDMRESDSDCCRYDALVQEKEELEEEFENFRREVDAVNAGTTSREVRAAQKIIHNLEVSKCACWLLDI